MNQQAKEDNLASGSLPKTSHTHPDYFLRITLVCAATIAIAILISRSVYPSEFSSVEAKVRHLHHQSQLSNAEPLHAIRWDHSYSFEGLKILSTRPLSRQQQRSLLAQRHRAEAVYLSYFGKKEHAIRPLELRIVSLEMLNDPHYFYVAPKDQGYGKYLGRYFAEHAITYLSPRVLRNSQDFSHELAHYFADQYGIHPHATQEKHADWFEVYYASYSVDLWDH